MQKKTITITVPVLPNPVKKLNELRKDVQRSFLGTKAAIQYKRGDILEALSTYQKYQNV